MRVRHVVPVTAAAAGIVASAAGSGLSATGKDSFQLKGEVYSNALRKIEMKNQAGRRLTSASPGTYRIKVEDKGTNHNFHLTGPGVNRATSIPRRVDDLFWTVTLRKGTYTFLCDRHDDTMRGTFKVA